MCASTIPDVKPRLLEAYAEKYASDPYFRTCLQAIVKGKCQPENFSEYIVETRSMKTTTVG